MSNAEVNKRIAAYRDARESGYITEQQYQNAMRSLRKLATVTYDGLREPALHVTPCKPWHSSNF